uniref:Uncharacterized protein n=1 Tax=Cladonia uncialis subsp. uncialis TaxID=180999 RepID=A0A2K9YD85_CLAUC|nr:hypothetical protein [Cladonia uncialis subsp. uncialis]
MSRRSVFDPCLDSEMRDDDLGDFNLETPLRALPPRIGENWSSQDPSSFDGNSGRTSVPSQNTLCLQNVTRTGSSAEYTRSYTSAPPSSPNLNHHLLPSSRHKTIDGGAVQTMFVLEQPEKANRKKDKLTRSCMACFAKKQPCHVNDDPNRCRHCIGEDRYCRGAIYTPKYIDLDLLNATAADFSIKHGQAGEPSLPTRASLKVESNHNTATILGERSFDVELQELRRVPSPSRECPMLDGMLDQVFLASAPYSLQNVSTFPELATYEHTIFALVGLLCHISRKASIIYDQIFNEIRAHCNAIRDPRRTPQIMFVLTRYLGSMYKAVRYFEESLSQWNGSLFWPRSFLLDPHQTLNGIKHLGMGLSAKGFVEGQLADALELGAIHITLHSVSCPTTVRYPINYGAENVCVLQALSYKSLQYRAREEPKFSTYDVAPTRSVRIFDVDSQSTEFELSTESNGRAIGDFDQQGISSASTVVEDQGASDFKNLPKDLYDTLDVSWGYSDMTAPLHDAHVGNGLNFATAQPPRVSMIGTVQDGLQDPAATYITPLQESWDLSNSTVPSPEYFASNGNLNENDMSSNNNPVGGATGLSQNADMSRGRPIKRQRLKSLASSKKKRLATNGHARNERSDILEKAPAAMNTTRNDQASTTMPTVPILSHSKSLHKEVSLQIIRTDRSAEWDRRRSRTTDLNDAIVVKDVNISNSDRRPLSWPRRNALRRSLDLSVEVLRSKLKNCQIAD